MTRAWLVLVANALRDTQALTSRDLLARHPALLDRELLSRHYSKELLTTVHARAVFVAPDREPLPQIP